MDLRNRPEATGGHGYQDFVSSFQDYNPLIEIYPSMDTPRTLTRTDTDERSYAVDAVEQ